MIKNAEKTNKSEASSKISIKKFDYLKKKKNVPVVLSDYKK